MYLYSTKLKSQITIFNKMRNCIQTQGIYRGCIHQGMLIAVNWKRHHKAKNFGTKKAYTFAVLYVKFIVAGVLEEQGYIRKQYILCL